MPRFEIDVELVACPVGVVAEPGDLLVVWRGMCLGLNEPPAAGRVPAVSRKSSTRPLADPSAGRITDAAILAALDGWDRSTRELGDHFLLVRGSRERARLGGTLRRLALVGLVRCLDGGRFHRWSLTDVGRSRLVETGGGREDGR